MHKPHIRHGRFYNSTTDSIFTRLKEAVRVIWKIFVAIIQGKHSKKKILGPVDIFDYWHQKMLIQADISHPTITWLGHATFLLQINGINIITDPVFFNISTFIPRLLKTPINPNLLPQIDIILLSHNHRDHLDEKSMKILKKHQPTVCVPLGDEAWFISRGFKKVFGHSWWETNLIKNITLTFLPASHWSGRELCDINRSLWGSWMIQSNEITIYFAGDTAFANHFNMIGQKFKSIDIALMPIGPQEPRILMQDSHIGAEEAVEGFIATGAHNFIPMHWGTFAFGLDTFLLPIERLKTFWQTEEKRLINKKLWLVPCGKPLQFNELHTTNIFSTEMTNINNNTESIHQ